MFKLVRNMLANNKTIVNGKTNQAIRWDFISRLHTIQQEEGLRLANKLKRNHLEFASQKMKVNLSVQGLSNSTAQALLCLRDLGYADFQGCDETVEFTKVVDKLFDVMNSRNPLGKGYKSPLRAENPKSWMPFLNKAEVYLSNLKTASGDYIYTTKRKTPIIGYILMIRSVKALFQELVHKDQAHLKYLLTYKFSQDYLELFFSAVRGMNGWNNNPTSSQFKAAYRRLLHLHDGMIEQSGNCIPQTEASVLPCVPDGTSLPSIVPSSRKYDFDSNMVDTPDHDYCISSPSDCLSPMVSTVITYIAGYVARELIRTFECKSCANALYTTSPPDYDKRFILINLKNNGGLIYLALDVLKIVEITERVFRRYLAMYCGKPSSSKGLLAEHDN